MSAIQHSVGCCHHCGCTFRREQDKQNHCCAAMQQAEETTELCLSCQMIAVTEGVIPTICDRCDPPRERR